MRQRTRMSVAIATAVASLVVVASAAAVLPAPGGGSHPAPASCEGAGHGSGKFNCFFWVPGDGHSAGAPVRSGSGHRVGFLNYGTDWVVCQQQGREQSSGAFHNDWWAWTEANDLHWGWVNAVYAHGGDNDGKFGGGVSGCHGRHGAPPHHTPPPPPPPKTYVALGDSYSSGTGTKNYDLSSHCMRSSQAFAPLVASAMHFRLTGFEACSGAKTSDVLAKQIGAVTSKTNVVTISVGGDDAGFATIVWNCLVERWKCASSIHSAEDFMRHDLPLKLDEVYSAIQTRAAPHAQVIVVGYARLFKGTCQNSLSPFGADQARLDTAADILDGVIGHEAGTYGFTFLDPRAAFDNHSVCGHPPWINSASVSHKNETYHPNDAGYRAYARLVEADLG
jgi:lysophospholipase L1-like esterase